MSINLNPWQVATSELPAGVQRVFKDTLALIASGKLKVAYGTNYTDQGNPCLVNATRSLIVATQNNKDPLNIYPNVVEAWDQIHREFYSHGINTEAIISCVRTYTGYGIVSPLAAEILLKHFGTDSAPTVAQEVEEAVRGAAFENAVYQEPSDEELARDWFNAISQETTNLQCEVEPNGSNR